MSALIGSASGRTASRVRIDPLAPRRGGVFFLVRVLLRELCIFMQRRVQGLDHLIHVLLLNHIRRQKAQHGFVRAIDDNSFLQQLLGHRLRQFRRIDFHRLHQACSADVLNRLVLLVQRPERGVKIFAERAHVLQQFLFLAQELDGHGAGERASAERGPVHAWMYATRNPLGGQDGAEWQTARQRLRDGNHVGRHTIVLVGKMASGAAEATLNLVEHEQRAALLGQARGEFEKFLIDRANPAFSLDGLDAHSADSGIEFPLQVVEVVELDETHTGQWRNKRSSILRLTGSSQRAKSASMKGVVHGENARLWIWFASVLMVGLRKSASEFERAFPGFGTAVAKESAIKPRDFDQQPDRKSTRLNSSHANISYAVF